jgi:type III secretory pathway component EscU
MAAVPRTEPFAIASIVCAVANFFGAFVIGAILAIVFGKMAQKNIAQNPALEGAGLARAGVIVGWVGVGLMVAFIVFAVGLFGVFSTSNSEIIQVPN